MKFECLEAICEFMFWVCDEVHTTLNSVLLAWTTEPPAYFGVVVFDELLGSFG
jgi:hypothetical protein